MRINILLTALLITIFSSDLFALYDTPFYGVDTTRPFKFEMRQKKTNNVIGHETIKYSKETIDKKELLFVTSDIDQISGGKKHQAKAVIRYLLDGNNIAAIGQTTEIKKEGNPFQTLQVDFDWQNMRGTFEKKDYEANKKETKVSPLTKKTLTARSLYFYISNLIRNNIKEDRIKMIVPSGDAVEMELKISNQPEEISTKTRKEKCYKVELKPKVGIFSSFLAPLYFWYTTTSPHYFIRYEGPEKGPGSEEIIQEAI